MSNYVTAPITGDKLHGAFRVVEPALESDTHERRRPLTPEEEMRLAGIINRLVSVTRAALWFDPLTDNKRLRAFGEPVSLDNQELVYVLRQEGAIFPAATDQSFNSDTLLAA